MAWVLLKNEYEGNDKTKRMQVLNLKREFEMQKMKETESLKDYTERLKKVVNKIRLLREELPDDRVVEKILTFFMHLKLKNNEGPTGMKVTLREHSKQMSECTNHMTFDESLFKEIDKTVISKVKIGGVAAACEICQLGKQTRLPFPVGKTWRATEKLQPIHTDVCGGRLKVCRDVKFDETARWYWDKNEPENIKEESGEFLDDERIDDIPVRGIQGHLLKFMKGAM
nr:probable LRR receptor-like serine/threonine-protein kinase At3g47570 [Ipomoea batatas]